jgi:hypothetical protein
MKKLFLILTAALGLTISAHAQYGSVENFYQANPDVNTGQYAGRVVNPAYWLVDSNRWNEMDSRLTDAGFVRLGISSWQSDNSSGGGVPQKSVAMDYAKNIGADVIIYAIYSAADKYDWTSHYVGFYAKPNVLRASPVSNRPSEAQATAAINRYQDAHHAPHLAGVVTYDAQTDTYNWIGPKTGQSVSEPADRFLHSFGRYL